MKSVIIFIRRSGRLLVGAAIILFLHQSYQVLKNFTIGPTPPENATFFLLDRLLYFIVLIAGGLWMFSGRGLNLKLWSGPSHFVIGALWGGLFFGLIFSFLYFGGLIKSEETPAFFFWRMVGTGIMTVLAEEILYRGLVLEYFRRTAGILIAIFFQAILFALIHSGPAIALMFLFGLLLGLCAVRYGLPGAIGAHMAYNCCLLLGVALS